MAHLNSEELLDLAEGTRSESALPHLEWCARCRHDLAELRTALAVVGPAADPLPEPSPLFWDHLSARVQQAIAAEVVPSERWAERWRSWKIALPLTAVVAVLIAVALVFRQAAPSTSLTPSTVAEQTVSPVDGGLVPDDSLDDPSWSLLSDLAGDLDWDAAVEAGLIGPAGGVDRAVFDLNSDERRELERLLKEELARAGA